MAKSAPYGVALAVAVGLMMGTRPAGADVPRLIQYQGKLLTSSGTALAGPVGLRLRLYSHPTAAGPVLFDETFSPVPLNRGLFNILIGSQTSGGLPESVLGGSSVYLGVSIDGAAELSPRRRIATAPFASKTRSAEQLVRPETAQAAVSVDAAGRVGVGTQTPSPAAALDISSTSGGMLVPRMTTAQRDAIGTPDSGLFLFNLDSNCFNMWDGVTWRQSCFDCTFPAPTPSNNGPICEGSTLTLAATSISGATYAWTGPNGFSSTDQNPSIVDATPSASGPYSVTATLNGCTTTPSTTVATVNPTPTSPTVGDNSPICEGETLLLTSTSVPGATYAWTGPNGFESNVQNPIIPNATASASGSYTLVISVNGCPAAPAALTASVVAVPAAPGDVSGQATACVNATGVLYSVSDVPGATTYTWSVPAGASVASGQGTAFATVNFGMSSGNVCVTAGNMCGTSAASCLSVNVSEITSCRIVQLCNPAAPSGQYTIDPDGAGGGNPPFSAYCDMATDGGGWTIVTAQTASTGQPGLTSDSEAGGNPLSFQTYNLNANRKELLSAICTESLIRRSAGPWIKIDRALFDNNLIGSGNQHSHYSVTVIADDGATATNCQMGYSNFNNNNGGNYGLTASGGSFDHHSPDYYHLNSGCANELFYSYGSTYGVNTGLGSWVSTSACDSNNTAIGPWYAAMR